MKTISLQLYGFAKWTRTERFVLLDGPAPECLRLVHGKELPVPKGWNSLLPTWEPQVNHCKELPVPRGWNSWFPTWEPEVTIASNCRFPEVGTHASQPGKHRLPLQGTACSQRLELLVPNLGTMGYHCKQLLNDTKTFSLQLYGFA